MTPIAAAATAGGLLTTGAVTALIAMHFATTAQDRAEPYTSRWRRARGIRHASRPLAVALYTPIPLLYAVGGEKVFAAMWFLLMAGTVWITRLNRQSEMHRRLAILQVIQHRIIELTSWHEAWRRWDSDGRPLYGVDYEHVMAAPWRSR